MTASPLIDASNAQPRGRGLLIRELGVIGVLVLEIALFAVLVRQSNGSDEWLFLKTSNLMDVVASAAVIGIAALGVTVVIIAGGIDLSVGGVIALSCVITAGVIRSGHGVPAAVALALAAGAGSGIVAATLVTFAELPPFIATLALMLITRGLAFVITDGQNWAIDPEHPFTAVFGNSAPLVLPYPAVLLIVVAVVLAFLTARTAWGRQVFAVGGNETSARYAGVNVAWIKWSVYILSGALAALAGVVYAAKYGTGHSDAAPGYELDAVAAAVVGGASLSGGRGSVIGCLLGAIIFATLRSGLSQVAGASRYENVLVGAVVVAAVVVDRFIQRRVTRG